MTLPVYATVGEFRAACEAIRGQGLTLGLVPTMGALHAGHVALVELAGRHASAVAVTIFVNPTQFAPGEDLGRYPRSLEQDRRRCQEAGAFCVFAPTDGEMYPADEATRVRVGRLSQVLCGVTRPHHFEGVATVVTKLFGAAGPCVAAFGRKDYQQLKIVERLVRDLLLPVRVVSCPIVREPDGLALSSRNAYLNPDARRRAVALSRGLAKATVSFDRGERSVARLESVVREELRMASLVEDYTHIVDAESLEGLPRDGRIESRAVLAVAAYADHTRLIDNVVLGEDHAPLTDGAVHAG
jgi:pantoate--beta-alanine ligase